MKNEFLRDKTLHYIFNSFSSPLTRTCCAQPGDVVTFFHDGVKMSKGGQAVVIKNEDDFLFTAPLELKGEQVKSRKNMFCDGYHAQAVRIEETSFSNPNNAATADPQGAMMLSLNIGFPDLGLSAGVSLECLGSLVGERSGQPFKLMVIVSPRSLPTALDRIHMQRAKKICEQRHGSNPANHPTPLG